MAIRTATDRETIRLRIMQGLMFMGAVFILAMLWRLQVERGHHYASDATRQSVRRVRIPGRRGSIYDRNGQPLAVNNPGYSLAIYLEELREPGPWSNTIDRVKGVVDEVSAEIGMPSGITRDDIWNHIRKRLPLPLYGWQNMDAQALARWAEKTAGIPGIDIYPQPQRNYPQDDCASHLLGYVGRADQTPEEGERFDYYMPEYVGKSGVERSFNKYLRGEAGGYLVRVDVTGYRYEDEVLDSKMRPPRDGRDVQLALDLRIQHAAEDALGENVGSIVVLDPRNGDLLAMANSPRYNPNLFVPSIPLTIWNELRGDKRNPLFSRATMGCYSPGSTFKPIVAMAALENNLAKPDTEYECNGVFRLGNARFHCWYRPGHGKLNMIEALQNSCNVYFYNLGLHCGYEYIYHMASAMGFGRKTGVDLVERAGILPSDEWKRKRYNDGWRKGDTCNLSIGQGALVVTPLRMAVAAAALANRGLILKPRVALGIGDPNAEDYQSIDPVIVNDMHWHWDNIETVREGMHRVVMHPRGTGRRAQVEGVEIAGKTGTAEYGPRDNRRNNTWMIAFAPYENPRYAVAALVENGDSGGSTVAPIISKLFDAVFNRIEAEGGRG